MKEVIQRLEQELKEGYNGYEVNIEFQGAVKLFYKINHLKSLVSQQTILLSDGGYKEIEIQVDMITDIHIFDEYIVLDMFENYSIEITRVEKTEEFPTTGGEKVKEENVKCEM